MRRPTNDRAPTDTPAVDIFLIGGQSNAVGHGCAEASPTLPFGTAYEYGDPAKLVHLDDPVGATTIDGSAGECTASSGSPWPQFCRVYTTEAEGAVVLVQAAVGGSSLHADAALDGRGTWAASGALRRRAKTLLEDCRAYLHSLGRDYVVRGLLWSQGERDAQAVDDGTITGTDYEAALSDFLEWARRAVDAPIYIGQTGRPASGDTPGFRCVRDRQREVSTEFEGVHLASTAVVDFPDGGK